MKILPQLFGVSLLFISVHANAALIDFESLATNTVVTNQYSEVTFSGSTNNVVYDQNRPLGNFICTFGCTGDTFLDFTNPVNNLTFWVIQLDTIGKVAEFNVYENNVLTETIDLIGPGSGGEGAGYVDEFIDLSLYSNVTRLEIVNITDLPEEGGIGLDQFSFDVVVPIPPAIYLFGSGLLGLLGLARRKRA